MEKPNKRQTIERIVLIAIMFIIQIIWFFVIFSNIINYSIWVNLAFTLLSLIMILYLVRKNDSPAYRMSWISLMAIFPLFGGLLYLLIGNKRPTRRMKKQVERQVEKRETVMETYPHALELLAQRDRRLAGLSQYLYQFGTMPLYTQTDITYFGAGEAMMAPLLEDLRQAKKSIFIEFFIVEFGEMFDPILEILKEKAREGLDVRFIYDDFGCIARLPQHFDRELEACGIKALKFNPVHPVISLVYNTRDHRKFVVVDGEIAYTGGLNLADEYINARERFGYWKDNMIRMEGPATWSVTNLFLAMWNAFYPKKDSDLTAFLSPQYADYKAQWDDRKPGFVQPFGDSPLDREVLGENVYRTLTDLAVERLYIYTPYLVISYELQTALELAAKRGVDVRLITPGIPDKPMVFRLTRSYYRPLLEAGVKIYEYTPGFLHAKTFIVDGKIACVGTINLDYRSLYLHFETSTLLYYHPVITQIEADFLSAQAQSQRITPHRLRNNVFGEILDALLRLLAPFV